MLKLCDWCGNSFERVFNCQKYCSKECRHNRHNQAVVLRRALKKGYAACQNCRRKFGRLHNLQIYCCKECKRAACNKRHRDKRHYQTVCKGCGIIFTRSHRQHKFHSEQCRKRHNNKIKCATEKRRRKDAKTLRTLQKSRDSRCSFQGQEILQPQMQETSSQST